MKKLCLLLSLGLLLATGCTMAPRYVRPDAPIPSTYGDFSASGQTSPTEQNQALPPWRDFFKDPVMQALIETALTNNRDLRVSLLNVRKTRAAFRIQAADILPTINAAGNAQIERLPHDISPTGIAGIDRQYTATLGFSAFELDIFGRIRSLTEQALETYYSAEEEAYAAQITLVGEVAAAYLQAVADRELVDVTKDTYENRSQMYELIQRRFEAGVVSQLDVNQAKGSMEEARGSLAQYETQLGQMENALALLLGAPLPEESRKTRRLSDVAPLADVPEGLPSSLLERRPDIRAAEHTLKGANANIGAARANFFPTISLTGALGTMSADYDRLFSSGAGYWSFLPQVTLPIFDTGRNIASLRVSQAERDTAVARYEQAIQQGFKEVADTLVQREYIGEQLAAAAGLLQAAEHSYFLANARYTAGIDSFLTLLDAQRSLYSAQQGNISARLLREVNALNLYKSLGGGWN